MDIEQLNALVPPNLSKEELAKLAQQLAPQKWQQPKDPLAVMAAVRSAMEKVRPTKKG